MYYFLITIHAVLAIILCCVVLLQQSKGNGLAGAFGAAGAGEAMFGARGVTTILHKATVYLAVAFMVTSLGLVVLTARRSTAVVGDGATPGAALSIPTSHVSTPVLETPDAGTEPVPGAAIVPAATEQDSVNAVGGDEASDEGEGDTSAPEGESGDSGEENGESGSDESQG